MVARIGFIFWTQFFFLKGRSSGHQLPLTGLQKRKGYDCYSHTDEWHLRWLGLLFWGLWAISDVGGQGVVKPRLGKTYLILELTKMRVLNAPFSTPSYMLSLTPLRLLSMDLQGYPVTCKAFSLVPGCIVSVVIRTSYKLCFLISLVSWTVSLLLSRKLLLKWSGGSIGHPFLAPFRYALFIFPFSELDWSCFIFIGRRLLL